MAAALMEQTERQAAVFEAAATSCSPPSSMHFCQETPSARLAVPVTFTVCLDKGYFISKNEGELSAEEVLSAYRGLFQGEEWHPGLNELVDLSDAAMGKITADGMRSLVDLTWCVFKAHGLSSAKTAVYAPKDLPFGVSRIYSALSEESPEHVREFRDLLEAVAWLE